MLFKDLSSKPKKQQQQQRFKQRKISAFGFTFELEIWRTFDFHSVKTFVGPFPRAANKATPLQYTRMLLFNAGDGYSEAIVRGYRMGLLTTSQYSSLTQCESLEGKAGKVARQSGS
jgi:hypothetical protein